MAHASLIKFCMILCTYISFSAALLEEAEKMRLEAEPNHFNSAVPNNAFGSQGQPSAFIQPSSLPVGRQIAGANAASLQQKLIHQQQQAAPFSRQPVPPTLPTQLSGAPQSNTG